MTRQSESARISMDARTVRNDIGMQKTYPRTVYDPRLNNALVTHSKGTR
jgi:hypothetical protein